MPHPLRTDYAGRLSALARQGFVLRGAAMAVAVTVLTAASTAHGQLPAARLDVVWPPAVTSGGEPTHVTVEGDFLDGAHSLWFAEPHLSAAQATEPAANDASADATAPPIPGKFHVTATADLSAGAYDVRVSGILGVSNPRRIWVSPMPVVTAESPRFDLPSALAIQQDQIVAARATPQRVDHYRFTADEGQQLHIHCRALGIDSQMLPTLVLCDAEGRQMEFVRGTRWSDPYLSWRAPAGGEYIVCVHDHLYRGGAGCFYLLSVATGAADGEATWAARSPISLIAASADASPETPVTSSDAHQTETEPPAPIQLSPPATHTGRFAARAARASQSFEFPSAAGQRWLVETVSASRGAATDAHLTIDRVVPQESAPPQMERVLEADDTAWLPESLLGVQTRDPVVVFTAPHEGTYRVTLRDLQTTSRPEWDKRFQLSVRTPDPRFHLLAFPPHPSAIADRSTQYGCLLRRGESMVIEVAAVGMEGFFEPLAPQTSIAGGAMVVPDDSEWAWPIDIRVEGLPPGVTSQSVRLDRTARRGFITLTASSDAAPWTGPVRVVGRLESGGQSVEQEAEYRSIQWPAEPGARGLTVRECSQLMLAVSDQATAPLQVTATAEGNALAGTRGTTVDFPLSVVRGESATGRITLRMVGLPPDVRADDVVLEGDANQGIAKIQIGGNAPTGTFAIYANAESDFAWRRTPQAETAENTRVYAPSNCIALRIQAQ